LNRKRSDKAIQVLDAQVVADTGGNNDAKPVTRITQVVRRRRELSL
jgi:hypothetical protein